MANRPSLRSYIFFIYFTNNFNSLFLFDENTTLLITRFYDGQVLAGLLNPTEGEVHVNGPCSFVFQNPDHQVLMYSFTLLALYMNTEFFQFPTLPEKIELYLPDSYGLKLLGLIFSCKDSMLRMNSAIPLR